MKNDHVTTIEPHADGGQPPRVALVVGASSGIGAQTARQLAGDGWIVYAAARRLDRLQQLGGGVRPLVMDVADGASIAAALGILLAACGRLDALVNCAGWGGIGALEQTPLDEARRMFEVNLFGLAAVMQQVTPVMRAQGRGHIVNVASVAGRMPFPLSSWYVASKHAVVGLSASAAFELNLFGIQIAVVEPGAILTEFSEGLDASPDAHASGPYAGLLASVRQLAERSYRTQGVPPSVIAERIGAILNDPRPRLHHVMPAYARRDVWLSRLLPARWFRHLVNWQAGIRVPTASQ
ncbi:MAG: SDR family NAD(P)-dependent oxidoreductase [Pseudomonadota bacterium]